MCLRVPISSVPGDDLEQREPAQHAGEGVQVAECRDWKRARCLVCGIMAGSPSLAAAPQKKQDLCRWAILVVWSPSM